VSTWTKKKEKNGAGRPRGSGIGIPAEIFVFDLKGNTFLVEAPLVYPAVFLFLVFPFFSLVVTFLYAVW